MRASFIAVFAILRHIHGFRSRGVPRRTTAQGRLSRVGMGSAYPARTGGPHHRSAANNAMAGNFGVWLAMPATIAMAAPTVSARTHQTRGLLPGGECMTIFSFCMPRPSSLRREALGVLLPPCLIKLEHSPAGHTLISGQSARSTCLQYLSMTASACSLRREGCLMDKNKYFMWEASDDVPTALALVAAICLWGFVASAATIYSSTLGHWI